MKHLLILLLFLPLLSFGQNVLNNQFVDGETTIVGQIDKSQSDIIKERNISLINFMIDDPILGLQRSFDAKINDDLSFKVNLPLVINKQMIKISGAGIFEFYMLTSINDTSKFTIDIKKAIEQFNYNYAKSYEFVSFSGANADINYALSTSMISDFVNNIFYIKHTSYKIVKIEENREYFLKHKTSLKDSLENYFKLIDNSDFSPNAKEFCKIELKSQLAYHYSIILCNMINIYGYLFNSKLRNKMDVYSFKTELSNQLFSFIDDLGINQMYMCSTSKYYSFISNIKKLINFYIAPKSNQIKDFELYSELKKYIISTDLSNLNNIIYKILNNKKVKEETLLYFNQKYETEINKIKSDTLDIYDFHKGDEIILDMLKTQKIASPLLTNAPIDNSDLEKLKQNKNQFYYNYLSKLNNIYLKTSQGATLKEVSDAEGDELFNEIMNNYKDKVVLVDFWYAGCAACMIFAKYMHTYEQELINKGVAFVYITSSQNTSYEDYLKTSSSLFIGDSYYLSEKQMETITSKFSVKAWPTLLFINKKGKLVDKQVGVHYTEHQMLQKMVEEN
ncbi:MAG: TlpA family protein disulfide reductase [Bacteroidales bacterium]|nr:TlpA family protein disulfide reductase [Bacteroidales bacterium]